MNLTKILQRTNMIKVMVLGILLTVSGLNAYPTGHGDLHVFTNMKGVPTELPIWDRRKPFPIEGESLDIYRAIAGHKKLQLTPLEPIYVVVYINPGFVDFAFSTSSLGPCATGHVFDCGPMGTLKWSKNHWRISKRSGF